MKNSIAALVVIIAAALLMWWFFLPAPLNTTTTEDEINGIDSAMPVPGSEDITETEVIDVGESASTQVTLTANGFSPQTVTIKKGGSVTWTNEGAGGMWVASAKHPTHTVYDGTSLNEHCDTASTVVPLDQCDSGGAYTFTFDKAGSWNYHNHMNASHFGTVVVVE